VKTDCEAAAWQIGARTVPETIGACCDLVPEHILIEE
jgi:hypothetical protein